MKPGRGKAAHRAGEQGGNGNDIGQGNPCAAEAVAASCCPIPAPRHSESLYADSVKARGIPLEPKI
eukprot:181791-Amphidinium_carterae.1